MKARFVVGIALILALAGVYWIDTQLARPLASRIVLWLFALAVLREALLVGGRRVDVGPGLFAFAGVAVVAVVTPSLVSGHPVPGTMVALAALVAAGIRLLGMAPLRSVGTAFPEALLLAGAILYSAGLLTFLDRLACWSLPGAYAFVAVSKASDIGGYLVGSQIGRHKIAPAISPKKSWEGTVAGLLLSAGVAAGLHGVLVGPWHFAALIGLLIGLASLFGDLIESALKRWAGTKDSAALLPEFGGALDIADGILVAAPVAVVAFLGS